MTSTLTYTTKLDVISCGTCEIPFAIPSYMNRVAKDDGRSFYCPNGHKISYHTTEADQLRAKLEREERWRKNAETRAQAARDQAESAERSRAAYKGQLTKVKKRVGNGVCPCCNRTFANLGRHMAGQHPEFGGADA